MRSIRSKLTWLKPVDLSDVHPMKRMLLIGLRFMFCVTVALAICLQFQWILMECHVGRREVRVLGDQEGLFINWSPPGGSLFGLPKAFIQGGDYAPKAGSLPSEVFGPYMYRALESEGEYKVLPGITVWSGRRLVVAWTLVFARIHHSWLISLTGSLYFLARWRIRRTVTRAQRDDLATALREEKSCASRLARAIHCFTRPQ